MKGESRAALSWQPDHRRKFGYNLLATISPRVSRRILGEIGVQDHRFLVGPQSDFSSISR